jgi:hypothetical protein
MGNVLRLKKGEGLPAFVALVCFIVLNALTVYKYYHLVIHHVRGGFWTLFFKHIEISGYDSFFYQQLCYMRNLFGEFRHPLIPLMLWPFETLNQWMMNNYHVNLCQFIVAAFLVVAAFYSFLFLYRILHELVALGRGDALLLTALFFSFAHIMLATMVPDHFCFSMCLLLLTLYVAGCEMRDGRVRNSWVAGLLLFLTAGVTITNGAKVVIASFFTRGRRFFQWKHLLVAVVLPLALLGAACWLQYGTDLVFTWVPKEKATGKPVKQEAFYAHWMKHVDSRTDDVVENVFGESIQLHPSHLLQDRNKQRPVIVRYDAWYNYAVEALLVVLIIAGIVVGRRNRLLQLALTWVLLDAVIHLVLGFGIDEPYIYAAHYAFVWPLCIGFLMKKAQGNMCFAVRTVVCFLTFFLLTWNLRLVVSCFV